MNIPLFKIYFDEQDIDAVSTVIRSGMYWATGKEIDKFESEIAQYLGVKYCVVLNSGSAALHSLLIVKHLGPGDEIIVPSFSFISTAYSPILVGATPIFSDIEEKTYGLDVNSVNERITPKTKAIIPIHYGGCPCNISALKELAEDNNLFLIEDAAECFGGRIGRHYVGSFGDAAIFSFSQNKIITTGEGGCVVTNEKKIYDKLKQLLFHGRKINADDDYADLGYNWRMSSLAAALGMAQLNKVDDIIKMRKENANYMNERLNEITGIKIPKSDETDHVYQMYTIEVDKNIRNKLMLYLKNYNISSKIYFKPAHKYNVFKKYGIKNVNLPITKKIAEKVLTLPMYPHISKNEMDYIIDVIKNFFGGIYNE